MKNFLILILFAFLLSFTASADVDIDVGTDIEYVIQLDSSLDVTFEESSKVTYFIKSSDIVSEFSDKEINGSFGGCGTITVSDEEYPTLSKNILSDKIGNSSGGLPY